jgi:beta-fructofuranosidase
VHVGEIHLDSDETVALDDVRGNRLEIRAVFEWDSAEEFGLGICCSAGGEEQTLIRFNTNPNALNRAPDVLGPGRQAILDISRSSVSPTVSHRGLQQALVDHPYGEPVELRIFIDRSVVEVFVGDRHYLGRRIYPARPDSLGVQVFSKGGTARLNSLDAWPMKAIWPIET